MTRCMRSVRRSPAAWRPENDCKVELGGTGATCGKSPGSGAASIDAVFVSFRLGIWDKAIVCG